MTKGPFWSKENPSLTMINREENIKSSRNLLVRSKLRKVDPQYRADNGDNADDSEQNSEEDYPETKNGKIKCCHFIVDTHANVLFYLIVP